jgi:hypothetical protein
VAAYTVHVVYETSNISGFAATQTWFSVQMKTVIMTHVAFTDYVSCEYSRLLKAVI